MMNIEIVLGLWKLSNGDVLLLAARLTTSMTGNALFADDDIVAQVNITTVSATNLRNAIGAPLSDNKTDMIKIARDALNKNIKILAGKVQALANNPALPDDQRVNIVHSAGMEIKERTPRGRQVFAVIHGPVAGSVVLSAEAGPAAHEWQYTKDPNGLGARTPLRTTKASTTEATGLESYVKHAFFHKPVTDEETEWEGPLFIMVH